MNACFDLAAAACHTPVVAAWMIRPPLVSVEALIVAVFVCCTALFWVRSSVELKRQMYDRLYGPGVKTIPLDWWEADLDPIFVRSVRRLAKRWLPRQRRPGRQF